MSRVVMYQAHMSDDPVRQDLLNGLHMVKFLA